jgi:hypothetical protein
MPWLLAAIPLVGLIGFLLYEHSRTAAVTAPASVQAPAPPPPPPVTPTQVAQQAAQPKYTMKIILPVRAKAAPASAPPSPKPAPPKAATPSPTPAPSGPAGGNYTLSPGAATLRGGAWFFNIPAGSIWDTGQMSGTDAYQPLFMTDQAIFDTHGTPGVWTFAWTDATGTTQKMTVHFTA